MPDVWKMANLIIQTYLATLDGVKTLSMVSKLFKKLLLKTPKPIISKKNLIPTHQFGFRNKHSTTDQVHRITDTIEKAYEEKKIYSATFLDIPSPGVRQNLAQRTGAQVTKSTAKTKL